MPKWLKKFISQLWAKPPARVRETYACSGCAFTADTFGAILTHCGSTGHGWTGHPQ